MNYGDQLALILYIVALPDVLSMAGITDMLLRKLKEKNIEIKS